MEAPLPSLLGARAAEQLGTDCKQKVTGEQMDPLKSYCCVTKGNQLLLGYPKMPGFCLSHSLPSHCPGKQGSRGAAAHHAASLACTILPRSVPPSQAGREA